MRYLMGQPVKLDLETYATDGKLADPGVLPIVTVTRPDGITSTPAVTRLSTGRYRAEYTPTTFPRSGVASMVNASTTVTGANPGTFVADDVGAAISGPSIPVGATILSVNPAGNGSAVISAAALANDPFRTVTITRPALTGRYVAAWLATSPAATVKAEVFEVAAVTIGSTLLTAAAFREYAGTVSTTDGMINDAIAAETAAQSDCCRIPAAYPVALSQALKRRVARNLALRGLPLAVLQGDGDGGNLTLPGRDVEVRRLEAPYRKRKVG